MWQAAVTSCYSDVCIYIYISQFLNTASGCWSNVLWPERCLKSPSWREYGSDNFVAATSEFAGLGEQEKWLECNCQCLWGSAPLCFLNSGKNYREVGWKFLLGYLYANCLNARLVASVNLITSWVEGPVLGSLQHEGVLLMSGVPYRFVLASHLLETVLSLSQSGFAWHFCTVPEFRWALIIAHWCTNILFHTS